MKCKQNLFTVVTGFLIGNLVFALLIFGIYTFLDNQSSISFDEALSRIESNEVKEVNIKDKEANLRFRSGSEVFVSKISDDQQENLLEAVNYHNAGNYKDSIRLSVFPISANPMDKVFQIIFILFIISPPLIVLMLFLIWRELKVRNRLK
jgi:ATP-dependent Zn protease